MTAAREPFATVLVIEPDAALNEGLRSSLRESGCHVTGYDGAGGALTAPARPAPDCAVVDLDLPDADGLECQRLLAQRFPGVTTVFLAAPGALAPAVAVLKQGAVDVLEKPVVTAELLRAVGEARRLAATRRQGIGQRAHAREALHTLTAREREVLEYVIGGYLNKQIAAALCISEKTVKVHRARVMSKTRSCSVAELAWLCWTAGLVPRFGDLPVRRAHGPSMANRSPGEGVATDRRATG